MVENSREEMDMQETIYFQGFWHPQTIFTSSYHATVLKYFQKVQDHIG